MNHRLALILTLLLYAGLASFVRGADEPKPVIPSLLGVERTEDVIYGRKFGVALTMDVFKPAKPNGKAIIFIVSGGWYSAHSAISPPMYASFLQGGYTVFAVVHGSQPQFHIPELVGDIHRAVRFIRHNAKKYEIDPGKLGLIGMSAGGHLTLTLATQGTPGDPKAKDPIDRESSQVQAAVSFFPPTDFLNYGNPGVDAVGVGILKDYHAAFGPAVYTPEQRKIIGQAVSPANFVHADMPPTLIIHGDADQLVPVQQSRWFLEKAQAVKAPVKLIERAGKGHGWTDVEPDLDATNAWFEEHLTEKKKP